jgi:hypothetical protein
MVIRGNTVVAISKFADDFVEQKIRGEGAKNEEELQIRMKSRRGGIKLGANIYKQVLDVATQKGLPTGLEKKIEAKVVTPPQLS